MRPMKDWLKYIPWPIVYTGLVVGYVVYTNWRTHDYPEGAAAAIWYFPVITFFSLLEAAAVAMIAGLYGKERRKVAFHITFLMTDSGDPKPIYD